MKAQPTIGHNSAQQAITVTVRAFNSMIHHCDVESLHAPRSYPAGTTVGDIARDLGLPADAIFLVLVNGRDISPGLVGQVRLSHEPADGDVVAFSGPVPYSFGYGAPVV